MYQVGITGGIGSGKTLVCSIFEKLGIPVYYADSEAKRLMNSDQELVRHIVKLFGEDAYNGASLNREFLSEMVFGNPELLAKLNSTVHPAVRKDFVLWVESQRDAPYVLEEAAILFESGADRYLDRSVLVYAPEAMRIRRVMQRDGLDEERVRRRMIHQMDETAKMKLADHIIYNDETELLLPQIIALHKKLLTSR
ncbi:MAG: dephospho-CoA kinase [Bacteroidota bacterium]